MVRIFVLLASLFASSFALAQGEHNGVDFDEDGVAIVIPTSFPADMPDLQLQPVGDALSGLVDAIHGGQWLLVLGFAIMILLSGMRLLWGVWASKDGIRPYLPVIALAMSVLAMIATGLVGKQGWDTILKALIPAVVGGLTAIGGSDLKKKITESRAWAWLMTKIGRTPAAFVEKKAKDAAVALHKSGLSLSLDSSGNVMINGKPFKQP